MNIYEKLGVSTILNAAGPSTRYGGALMDVEALAAMEVAGHYSVHLEELQATASKLIARRTHAEAGLVTCGASAAITLGIAACLCGYDVCRMNRLPDTTGIPNEVVMPVHQISGYDHAIWASGARLIGAGIPNDTTPPHEVHRIASSEIRSAINERTVAIAYAPLEGSRPPLEEVIAIGHEHHIPVLVDAAALVPPVSNLSAFIDLGADLVCFSGGKGIRGPQASGILCGRYDLIASAALQMLDQAGESFERWTPPATLVPKEKLHSRPLHGIGRSMKVSKEAIIGLLVALDRMDDESFAACVEVQTARLSQLADTLKGVNGLEMAIVADKGGYRMLELRIDPTVTGVDAAAVYTRLKDRGVLLRDMLIDRGVLHVHSINLGDDDIIRLADSLQAVLCGAQ